METTKFGIRRKVDMTPDEAETKVRATLMEQGFGILTEINVQAIMKEKMDLEIKPYKILGACNPGYASKVIESEPEVGLLMPCNVIVYTDKNGDTIVSMMDPVSVMGMVDNADVAAVANEVKVKLTAALEAV